MGRLPDVDRPSSRRRWRPLGATLALHLEHGDWKIMQAHSAMPVTNESQGFELTTSVDELAESVSVARPDV